MLDPAKRAIDVGLVVSDLDASLDFYVSFLGLEVVDQIEVPFGAMQRLRFGDSLVKLIKPKKPRPLGELGLTGALGLRYLTFEVSNIAAVFDAANQKGVTIDLALHEMRPGVRVTMFRDPDGNVVEIVQRN